MLVIVIRLHYLWKWIAWKKWFYSIFICSLFLEPLPEIPGFYFTVIFLNCLFLKAPGFWRCSRASSVLLSNFSELCRIVWLHLANEEATFSPNCSSLTGVFGHLEKLRIQGEQREIAEHIHPVKLKHTWLTDHTHGLKMPSHLVSKSQGSWLVPQQAPDG